MDTPNVSPKALKEFDLKSVAEASAILASNHGSLILHKQKYQKVTIAICQQS